MTYKVAILLGAAVLANGCATAGGGGAGKLATLSPLTVSLTIPELRMWHTVALFDDDVEGVVVTPGVVRFYAGETLDSVEQVELFKTPEADEILRHIESLAAHNGKWLSCSRIKDGWGLEVEGISSTGHFAFAAHVPNVCSEGPPKEVFDIYSRLLALRE